MSKSHISQMERRVVKKTNLKINKRTGKCTSKAQYEKMIELVRTMPDIAQGSQRRSKDEIEEFWINVAQELNAKGPPIRNAVQWKKRWIVWKHYIKSKLAKCKKTNTRHLLSQMDEEVIDIAALDKPDAEEEENDIDIFECSTKKETVSISPTTVGAGYRSVRDSSPVKNRLSDSPERSFGKALHQQKTISMDIEILSESENNKDFFSYDEEEAISPASLQYNEEENEIKLLQQQLDIQKNLYKETTEHQKQTYTILQNISRGFNTLKGRIERMEEMNQQKLREEMRHNRKTEELLQKIVDFRRAENNRK